MCKNRQGNLPFTQWPALVIEAGPVPDSLRCAFRPPLLLRPRTTKRAFRWQSCGTPRRPAESWTGCGGRQRQPASSFPTSGVSGEDEASQGASARGVKPAMGGDVNPMGRGATKPKVECSATARSDGSRGSSSASVTAPSSVLLCHVHAGGWDAHERGARVQRVWGECGESSSHSGWRMLPQTTRVRATHPPGAQPCDGGGSTCSKQLKRFARVHRIFCPGLVMRTYVITGERSYS